MTTFTQPPATITAIVAGGLLTAIFPPVPYQRKVNSLVVDCSQTSTVSVYRSSVISPSSLIATHPVGSKNTYMPVNRDVIPAGFPMVVVWDNATSGTASATAVFEGEY